MKTELNLRVLPSEPTEVDFTWYQMIRTQLLKKMIQQAERVLDVGCGVGEDLLMLSQQIRNGIGVDISEKNICSARKSGREKGISNVEFIVTNALNLPFKSNMFDLVLCLGDVLCSSSLYEHQDVVVSEIWRVLKQDGLTVYDCMNWDWEYKSSSDWSFFTVSESGVFYFHRTKRTASGTEATYTYEVVSNTPLEDWVASQTWPSDYPQGDDVCNVSLDVVEESQIPDNYLVFRGVSKHQHYTPQSLRERYEGNRFKEVEVIPYGQTYDVVSKAGALDKVLPLRAELAEAEAEICFNLRVGGGPWLFLVGKK